MTIIFSICKSCCVIDHVPVNLIMHSTLYMIVAQPYDFYYNGFHPGWLKRRFDYFGKPHYIYD